MLCLADPDTALCTASRRSRAEQSRARRQFAVESLRPELAFWQLTGRRDTARSTQQLHAHAMTTIPARLAKTTISSGGWCGG